MENQHLYMLRTHCPIFCYFYQKGLTWIKSWKHETYPNGRTFFQMASFYSWKKKCKARVPGESTYYHHNEFNPCPCVTHTTNMALVIPSTIRNKWLCRARTGHQVKGLHNHLPGEAIGSPTNSSGANSIKNNETNKVKKYS